MIVKRMVESLTFLIVVNNDFWSFSLFMLALSKTFCTFASSIGWSSWYVRVLFMQEGGVSGSCGCWKRPKFSEPQWRCRYDFCGWNNWRVRFLFKSSLKLGREIDDSNLIRSECSRYRRGRLSYLLEWAPAKRLRRWISINCPRFSYALGWCHVIEELSFAFFNN